MISYIYVIGLFGLKKPRKRGAWNFKFKLTGRVKN